MQITIESMIVQACESLGIPTTRARLVATIVSERTKATSREGMIEAKTERDNRIRAEYNGRNGRAIASREGVSIRHVRRIANGE